MIFRNIISQYSLGLYIDTSILQVTFTLCGGGWLFVRAVNGDTVVTAATAVCCCGGGGMGSEPRSLSRSEAGVGWTTLFVDASVDNPAPQGKWDQNCNKWFIIYIIKCITIFNVLKSCKGSFRGTKICTFIHIGNIFNSFILKKNFQIYSNLVHDSWKYHIINFCKYQFHRHTGIFSLLLDRKSSGFARILHVFLPENGYLKNSRGAAPPSTPPPPPSYAYDQFAIWTRNNITWCNLIIYGWFWFTNSEWNLCIQLQQLVDITSLFDLPFN